MVLRDLQVSVIVKRCIAWVLAMCWASAVANAQLAFPNDGGLQSRSLQFQSLGLGYAPPGPLSDFHEARLHTLGAAGTASRAPYLSLTQDSVLRSDRIDVEISAEAGLFSGNSFLPGVFPINGVSAGQVVFDVSAPTPFSAFFGPFISYGNPAIGGPSTRVFAWLERTDAPLPRVFEVNDMTGAIGAVTGQLTPGRYRLQFGTGVLGLTELGIVGSFGAMAFVVPSPSAAIVGLCVVTAIRWRRTRLSKRP